MSRFLRHWRPVIAFIHDLIMAGVTFPCALWLSLGDLSIVLAILVDGVWVGWLLFVVIAAAVFFFTGLYRGIWSYTSFNDMLAIVRASSLTVVLYIPASFLATRLELVPRATPIIAWFLLTGLLAGSRSAYQVLRYGPSPLFWWRHAYHQVPVVLIGASERAATFIRALRRDRAAAYKVTAVIDIHGDQVGRRIDNVPILGRLAKLDDVLDDCKRLGREPQRLVITDDLDRETLKQILECAQSRGMSMARLPRLTEFQTGDGLFEPEPIRVEDLLRRPQAVLDETGPRALIRDRRILVTGAGGSIGSELARQIADYKPAEICLLDHSELALYRIDREIACQVPALARRAVLANIDSQSEIDHVLADFRPHIVLHAAALKHVPLVEANPAKGVLTNVLGTRYLADLCLQHGCERMVLISTDKAIMPSSVMGATKALAEAYCQALDREKTEKGTRYISVRFGNVLGSTGSVVPLFRDQLAQGGPLTVTHPEMRRYFMTVTEAIRLVLQAAALEDNRELDGESASSLVHVLDMGEPVYITQLAEQMIRLANKEPYHDIAIVYTGLRPGEKLHESLFHDSEISRPTTIPGLLYARSRVHDLTKLRDGFDGLGQWVLRGDRAALMDQIQSLLPDYQPFSLPSHDQVSAHSRLKPVFQTDSNNSQQSIVQARNNTR